MEVFAGQKTESFFKVGPLVGLVQEAVHDQSAPGSARDMSVVGSNAHFMGTSAVYSRANMLDKQQSYSETIKRRESLDTRLIPKDHYTYN